MTTPGSGLNWTRVAACWCLAFGTIAVWHEARPVRAQEGHDYIVTFRNGDQATRARAVGRSGARLRFNYGRVKAAAITVPNDAALAALRNDPSVLAVYRDQRISAHQKPNAKGPGGGGGTQVVPAGVTRVGAPTATSNGNGVGVAILDTGVDLLNADLTGAVDAFSAFGGSCQDDQSHGTHVAGIVAARDNNTGVVGVAPKAALFCVKVLDAGGSGTDATLMAGLDWVLDNHASVTPRIRVVNMSLGRTGSVDDNPALHDLIKELKAAGVAVVASAGNDPLAETSQMIPAGYDEVISVASTTAVAGTNQCRFLSSPIAVDAASYFTTDGVGVAVSAPGEEREDVSRGCFISSLGILSTRLGGGTTRMSGTSMAAPHVTGIAARFFQQNASSSVDQLRQSLVVGAARQGVAPLDSPSTAYTYDGVREGVAQAPSF